MTHRLALPSMLFDHDAARGQEQPDVGQREEAEVQPVGGRVCQVRETAAQQPPAHTPVRSVRQQQDQPAVRAQDARKLIQCVLMVKPVLQLRIRNDHVEAGRLEGQRAGVDVALPGIDPARLGFGDRDVGEIGHGHRCAGRRHHLGQPTGAAVHLEDALAGLHPPRKQSQAVADLPGPLSEPNRRRRNERSPSVSRQDQWQVGTPTRGRSCGCR